MEWRKAVDTYSESIIHLELLNHVTAFYNGLKVTKI